MNCDKHHIEFTLTSPMNLILCLHATIIKELCIFAPLKKHILPEGAATTWC